MLAVARRERAGGVTLIAWIWLFTAAVTGLAGVAGILTAGSVARVSGELDGLLAGSWTGDVSAFLLAHLALVSLLHVLLALIKGAAGVGLLRGWRVARRMTVALCWFSIAYDLVVGVHLIGVWWASAGTLFADGSPLLYQISGCLLLVVLVFALVVPLPIMIVYLGRLRR